MMKKLKRFFKNPLCLLAVVVSVAALGVGSIFAFNAKAKSLDADGNYSLFEFENIYLPYSESSAELFNINKDIRIKPYYQEKCEVTEGWTIQYLSAYGKYQPSVNFDDSEGNQIDLYNYYNSTVSVKADKPDSGLDKKVWVYDVSSDSSNQYHCVCKGYITVGDLLNGSKFNEKQTLVTLDYYNGSTYTEYGESNFTAAFDSYGVLESADSSTADGTTQLGLHYVIADEKPYTYSGSGINSTNYNNQFRPCGSMSLVELFYAAAPAMTYDASYMGLKDIPYGAPINMKKVTNPSTGKYSFAFSHKATIPICTETGEVAACRLGLMVDGELTNMIDVSSYEAVQNISESKDYVIYICGSYDYWDNKYYYYANVVEETIGFGGYLDASVKVGTPTTVPLAVRIEYDYKNYGTGINNYSLHGTGETFYSDIDYLSSNAVGVEHLVDSFEFAGDNLPKFRPRGTTEDCEMEFWRGKDVSYSKYEKGTSYVVSTILKDYCGGDNEALASKLKFNPSTGFWEATIYIEPVFENCYLTVTYHDGLYEPDPQYSFSSSEYYIYKYTDSAGDLLTSPEKPQAKLRNNESVNWIDDTEYYNDYSSYSQYVRTGQKFKEWNDDSSGTGKVYAIGESFELSDNLDVYAQWTYLTYHLNYEFQSPTGDDKDVVIYKYGEPNNIIKIYDPNETYGDDDIVFYKEITFSGNTELDSPPGLDLFNYIENNGDYYTSFINGNTSNPQFSVDLTEAGRSKLPENLRDSISFSGLSLSKDDIYGGLWSLSLSDFQKGEDGDYYATIYFAWNQPIYHLIYNENKGSHLGRVINMPEYPDDYTQYITVTYTQLAKGYELASVGKDGKNPPQFRSSGTESLKFAGWGRTEDATSSIEGGTYGIIYYSDYSNLQSEDEINVYAIWKPGVSVTYDDNVPNDAKIQCTGDVPKDTTEYNTGGTFTVLGNVGQGDDPLPLAREGFVFSGWNSNPEGGNATKYEIGSEHTLTQNIILYAQWTPIPYKLIYDDNSPDGSEVKNMPSAEEFNAESDNIKIDAYDAKAYYFFPDSNPTCAGYEFKGWSTDPEAVSDDVTHGEMESVALGSFVENSEGVYECTVYAIWNPAKYTIKYDANKPKDDFTYSYGGEENKLPPDRTNLTVTQFPLNSETKKHTYSLSESLTPPDGYRFLGWNTDKNATKAQDVLTIEDDFVDKTEVTLYAVWTEITYTLEYVDNKPEGVTDSVENMPFSENENKETLKYSEVSGGHNLSEKTPTLTGYTFKGWRIDGHEDLLQPNGALTLDDFKGAAGGKVTAAAQWAKQYKVTYKNGYIDGSTEDKVFTLDEGSTHTIIAAGIREGYAFTGWTVSPNDKDYPTQVGVQVTVNEDITYTGNWKQKHNVRYELNGTVPSGVTPPTSGEYCEDNEVTVEAVPAYNNKQYTFSGWSSNDVTIQDGKFTMPDKDVVITGTFSEITYTLKYEEGTPKGAAGIPETATFKYNGFTDDKYSLTSTPTLTGYTFKGWAIKDTTDIITSVPISSFTKENNYTVTVVAQWTINKHSVKYEINCPAGVDISSILKDYTLPTETDKDYGAEVVVEAAPAAGTNYNGKQYTFSGWSSDDVTIQGGKFTMPNNDVVITGTFSEITYTVTYQPGDGASGESVVVENIKYNTTHTMKDITECGFNKEGYDFDCWELVEPKDKEYPTTRKPNETITVEDNVIYKAKWKIKTFTVTYKDEKFGNAQQSETVNYEASHNVKQYNTFTHTGWTVTGWTLTEPAGGSYSTTPNDTITVKDNITYTAQWTINKHSVTYVINYPAGVTDSILTNYTLPTETDKDYEAEVTVKAAPAAGTNYNSNQYTFSGWSSSDVTITGGKFTMPDKDVVITGTFSEKDKLTLTYNANGGTGNVPATQSYYPNTEVTVAEKGNLKRTGYHFECWNTQADGNGQDYNENGTISITQNTTLYAQWTPNKHNVIYRGENGNELYKDNLDYGVSFTVRDKPSDVTGKRCTGWAIVNGSQTKDADGNTITGSGTYRMPDGDVIFQAQYQWIDYTVTYQVTGAPAGYTKPAGETRHYGDNVTVAAVPSIEGYSFDGWNINGNKAGASFTMPADNVTVTGTFTKLNQVTLTYDANGGTPVSAVPSSESAYTELVTKIKNHTGLTKTGYVFDGWKDGRGTAYAIGSEHTFNQSTTLYAQWKLASFDVEYYESNGSTLITTSKYEYRQNVLVGNNVTPTVGEGYEFDKWELMSDGEQTDANGAVIGGKTGYPMPAGTVKYKAVLKPKSYTVTYVLDGKPADFNYVTPAQRAYDYGTNVSVEAIPSGYDSSKYTFTGWTYNGNNSDYNGKTYTGADHFVIKENVTLHGLFEPVDVDDKVVITYTSGSLALGVDRTEYVTIGSKYTVQDNNGWTNYVNPGYTFAGWKVTKKDSKFSLLEALASLFTSDEINVGTILNAGDEIESLEESITLEAQWRAAEFTVTYNSNGATGGSAPKDDNKYAYGETATVKDKGNMVKDGATFVNWNTDPNGRGKAWSSGDKMEMTANVTLYAIWSAKPGEGGGSTDDWYTLTYDANGATGGSVPVDYTHYYGGERVSVMSKGNLVKDGCTFKEWNTRPDGTGTGYNENDILTMPKSDVTLYAIWLDGNGNIVVPQTGEGNFFVQMACSMLIISLLFIACVVDRFRRKRGTLFGKA